MKSTFALLCVLFLCIYSLTAQTKTYTVDGTSYELRTEVKGSISLLWNVFDQEFRYFVEKEGTIMPLLNTKTENGYQEEYKSVLAQLTNNTETSTRKVRLTLASLRRYINAYNEQADPNFKSEEFLANLEYRIGVLGGITNNIFTNNPDNESTAQAGIEFELYDPINLPGHALIVQYKQTFSSSDFDFSLSQFSINYRYKFIRTSIISVFLNTKLATLTFSQSAESIRIENGETFVRDGGSNTSFQGALIFGLGADIKLGKGWLTLNYNDAYSFIIDDNGEFPVDLTIGYRFKL